MITKFRARTALEPSRIGSECLHSVGAPEAETALRQFAGRFVAVLRTATANARGNCVAWIAGFGTRDSARRALAEAMSASLSGYGHRLSAAEVEALGRRSYGAFVPEWHGPERRFERLSLLFHFGRVYLPLDREEEAADASAYEAYMARKQAEVEAALAAKAAVEAELKAAEERRLAIRRAREEAERRAREELEDEDAVSRLLWREYDRQIEVCRSLQEAHQRKLSSAARSLKWAGVRWKETDTPEGAIALAHQDWFRHWCAGDRRMRDLRWSLLQEAYAVLDAHSGAMEAAEDLLPRIRHAVACLRAASRSIALRR